MQLLLSHVSMRDIGLWPLNSASPIAQHSAGIIRVLGTNIPGIHMIECMFSMQLRTPMAQLSWKRLSSTGFKVARLHCIKFWFQCLISMIATIEGYNNDYILLYNDIVCSLCTWLILIYDAIWYYDGTCMLHIMTYMLDMLVVFLSLGVLSMPPPPAH